MLLRAKWGSTQWTSWHSNEHQSEALLNKVAPGGLGSLIIFEAL
jgi:hypothetical protein